MKHATARRLRLCVTVALWLLAATTTAAATPVRPDAAHPTHADRDAALAAAAALRGDRRWLEALAVYERLQAIAPDDGEVYRLRTLTLADLGSADLAWTLQQARPELFDEAQRRRLAADRIARLARWGGVIPVDESDRLHDMQRAAQAVASAAPSLRQRFDQLVILNGLEQHAQAANHYRQLRSEGIDIPPYALAAAGDSLLAARRPLEAIEALEGATAALPNDIDTQVVLAYAYLEAGRPADAEAHLQRIVADEPAWERQPGAKAGYPNWKRYSAETNLAMVRAYSMDPARAQAMLEPMVAYAPHSADLHSKLGLVLMQRGYDEQALQRFDIAHTQDPRNLEARIGQVGALAELGRMRRARAAHDALLAAYPGNVHARRLDREWRSRVGWQVEASARRGRSDADDSATSASPLGARDGGHALSVYSPLLSDRWRIGAFREERWAEFDDSVATEPRVRDLRHGVGLRYRHDRLQLQLHAARSNDRRDDPRAVDATAVGVAADWRFSDVLHGRLQAERNSAEASLQAREAGLLGDTAAIGVDWTPDERSGLGAELRQWRYDDGNRREFAAVNGYRQLLVRPRLAVELRGGVHASRGSRDDASYFNPSRDAGWNLATTLKTTHWRRYEIAFSQRFGAGIGQYWQQDFGSAAIPSLQYRHEWELGTGRHLEYGLAWSRPVYDGVRERHLSFDIQLRWGN